MFYFRDNADTYHHFLLCGDVAEELGTARMAGREVGNAVNATDRFQVVVGTRATYVTGRRQIRFYFKLFQFGAEIIERISDPLYRHSIYNGHVSEIWNLFHE